MVDKETWKYNPAWRQYVLEHWEGRGRVEQVKDDSLSDFKEASRQAFVRRGFPVKQVKVWINCMLPESGEGYSDGYPHVHYPLTGLTLVHYLDIGEGDTTLDIFDGDKVIEKVHPEAGLTVFMPNDLKHGVHRHNGKTKRLAMIATALR